MSGVSQGSDPLHATADEVSLGLSSIHALVCALDERVDQCGMEQAIRAWMTEQVGGHDVMIEFGHRALTGERPIELRDTHDKGTLILLDATVHKPTTLMIASSLDSDAIDDHTRHMLVIVGRLFGAALSRLPSKAFSGIVEAPAIPARRDDLSLGSSVHAQQLAATLHRLAKCDVNVLLGGETGVGKTFVARLIHENSSRAAQPLRIVNCSALPETLIESQLFGHERGTFTGANAAHIGMLEAAGAGTILLDEIGELSLASQAKLLHVLEDRRFERLGSNRPIELRARVICASNRNLQDMVAAGQFRQDLLFRISVVRVHVPPLRERGDDLLTLAHKLLSDAAPSASRPVKGFSDEAIELMRAYSWPGNVRELRNAIECALALGSAELIAPCDLPADIYPNRTQPIDPDIVHLPSALSILERRAIDASLRATNGNRVRAAEILGVTRQTLYNKLRLHNL